MAQRLAVLIAAGVLVAVCAGCIGSAFAGAMTQEQYNVLIMFLIVLLGIVAAILLTR